MYSEKSMFLIVTILTLFATCNGGPAYYPGGQTNQIRFPTEDLESAQSPKNLPIPFSSSRDIAVDPVVNNDNDGNDNEELLKDLPANIDLNNLTPEQKAAFDELLALAEEEDSQVQGRTFGLISHKFKFLWNKFISLFHPHKFFEFEHTPIIGYGGGGPGGDHYPLKRVQPEPFFPTLLGGITRYLTGTPVVYNAGPGPYGPPPPNYYDDDVVHTKDEGQSRVLFQQS